jgi:multidrug transporter EmrE-like cation transporter
LKDQNAMSKLVLFLIACSVMLSSVAQILLKKGMSNTEVLRAINSGLTLNIMKEISTNVHVFSGLFLYFSSAAVWLLVLAKTDVSTAYPFVGVGFVVTMLLAFAINGETLTMAKVTGTLLIALGVAVIARG